MSNLLKQYNTVDSTQNVRMIDYNSMVAKKLEELEKFRLGTNGSVEDDFRSLGDIAEEAEVEKPEEVLQKAKEEAEKILSRARTESEEILSLAQTKSEELYEQSKEKGYKEGYEKGSSKIKEELETEYEHRKEEVERLKLELQEDYNQNMQELEPKLLEVILTVVEKVFHIQFHDKKDILLYLIGNTISNVEGSRSFRLRVGEEQKAFLEYHKEEILERIGHDMFLEILSDTSMEGNQCIIETDTGVFDCSLGVQLENLIKDMKSLVS